MKHRTVVTVAATAIVAALVTGGIAWGTIPTSSGTYTGCYGNSTGALRVIDKSAGAVCAADETQIQWSRTGPRGLQGEPGPQGAPGTPAAALPGRVITMAKNVVVAPGTTWQSDVVDTTDCKMLIPYASPQIEWVAPRVWDFFARVIGDPIDVGFELEPRSAFTYNQNALPLVPINVYNEVDAVRGPDMVPPALSASYINNAATPTTITLEVYCRRS